MLPFAAGSSESMNASSSPYGARAVKDGIMAFLVGRGVSAILTFTAFALAARLLPLPEYGVYMALLATMELGLAFSSAGLDWVAARSLPEYRVHAAGRDTVILALKLAGIQALAFLFGGSFLTVTAPFLSDLLKLEGAGELMSLAGALLAIEGLGRLSRDQLLGVLMRQRSGQIAQITRAGVFLGLLAQAYLNDVPLLAREAVVFELVAGSVAAVIGAVLLGRVLIDLWHLPAPHGETWEPTDLKTLRRLARNAYLSYLLALTYGPQVLTILVARILGPEFAAIFGFARGFADQVRRYLPTDLLQSILRPALIAYFASSRDSVGLMLRLGLWLKSALFVLLPLLVFFAIFGEKGGGVLGGDKFRDSWPIVLFMLIGSGAMAWRRVTELACNTLNRSEICVRSALPMPVVPLLLAVTLHLSQSLWPAVAVFVCAEMAFCWRVYYILAREGKVTGWQLISYLRMLASALLSCAILFVLRECMTITILGAVLATFFVSVPVLLLLRPFDALEVELLKKWAKSIGCRTSANK